MTTHTITRAAIVAEARSWIGTPYRHQGSLKGIGCDCLGLVRGVWRAVIGPEPEATPPYAPDWAEAGGGEPLAAAARRHLVPVPLVLSSSASNLIVPRERGREGCEGWRPGDVLLFRWRAGMPAKHAAIVTASDKMVHAHDGAAVAEVAIAPWWRRRLAYAFRFPGLTD
jgi:NlpC/P60 family putative phage cell wall peptidase